MFTVGGGVAERGAERVYDVTIWDGEKRLDRDDDASVRRAQQVSAIS